MSQLRPNPKISPELQSKAVKAIDSALFIKPEASLADQADHWETLSVIGLDTEFVRERTFYPKPGLIQLFDGETISLIDPIGRPAQNELSDLMKNQKITKVFHSVGEDLEIMQLVCGQVPKPPFDTQIAAAMLGFPLQYRYEVLVKDCFGAELEGGQARSDWCKRPLARNLLAYAASDVAWLVELKHLLSNSLEQAGRLEWLEEDCQRLVESAESVDHRLPLLRVKGCGHLSEAALGWLNRLSEWRELESRARDLPRSFVLKDNELVGIAEHAERGEGFKALDSLHNKDRRRHESALGAILEESRPEAIEKPLELKRLEAAERDALKSAQRQVRTLAERLKVDPALIASKRELTKLLFGDRPAWAEGWRKQFLPEIMA